MRRWHLWHAAMTCEGMMHGGAQLQRCAVVRIILPRAYSAGRPWTSRHLAGAGRGRWRPHSPVHSQREPARVNRTQALNAGQSGG